VSHRRTPRAETRSVSFFSSSCTAIDEDEDEEGSEEGVEEWICFQMVVRRRRTAWT